MKILRGSCLCGTVCYSVSPPFVQFYHCHCSRCRKSTGTAHATNLYAPRKQFMWTSGQNNIVHYDVIPKKRFASVFCKTCGAKVPYPRDENLMIIPAGSLDDDPNVTPHVHVFWDSRASWDDTHDLLPKFSERPNVWP